ncbi:MAG TPA: HlyD family secretion protein, partial [Sphingomicrobium sp.]|nr:HlyD family secretion protein [Sphingomicrobium sp.]
MNKMATEPMTATAAPAKVRRKVKLPAGKSALRTVLMLIVPALLIIGGAYYWLTSGGSVGTDDAQVKQDIVSVSAQVTGPIEQVYVRDGRHVKRGDILFRIDPAPFQVALENAEAQLAAAQLQTSQLRTQAAGTGADIVGEEANLKIKQNALGRQQALLKQGFTTRADYEDALNEVKTAEQQVADAKARAANAHAAIAPGEQPSIAQARAAVDKAKLDLERTTVRAPMDGVVENADSLQVGQMAVTGLGMLSVVHSQTAWVEANFKEKDVGKMVPGQRATIEVDAYPGQKFEGHVQSVGAGT